MFRLSQNNRCFQNSLAALSKNGKARFLCYQNVLGFRKESEVKSLSRVLLFATPWTVAYQAPPSMGFSSQEYGVGCHFLLQRIFPTQGSNPGLLHCRQMLYPLSHQGSQTILPVLHNFSTDCDFFMCKRGKLMTNFL